MTFVREVRKSKLLSRDENGENLLEVARQYFFWQVTSHSGRLQNYCPTVSRPSVAFSLALLVNHEKSTICWLFSIIGLLRAVAFSDILRRRHRKSLPIFARFWAKGVDYSFCPINSPRKGYWPSRPFETPLSINSCVRTKETEAQRFIDKDEIGDRRSFVTNARECVEK